MEAIFKPLMRIWQKMKPIQKGGAVAILFLLVVSLGRLFFFAPSVDEIAPDFTSIVHKEEDPKGFELFDTNTWIKGEKELQVLELRALKGQIEKDLIAFEGIERANVILDLPPHRQLYGAVQQAKASVILTLKTNFSLLPSHLRAITNHVAGAVRGLEPEKIAISDSQGRLYQSLNGEKMAPDQDDALEKQLCEKMSHLFTALVGKDNFFITLHLKRNEEQRTLSVSALVNESALKHVNQSEWCVLIAEQLKSLAEGYGLVVQPLIRSLSFLGIKTPPPEKVTRTINRQYLLIVCALIGFTASIFLFFRHNQKNQGRLQFKKTTEEGLLRLLSRLDIPLLANSLQNEDPKTIALMLSHLEPKRAEQIIGTLKGQLQDEVLDCLAKWDRT